MAERTRPRGSAISTVTLFIVITIVAVALEATTELGYFARAAISVTGGIIAAAIAQALVARRRHP